MAKKMAGQEGYDSVGRTVYNPTIHTRQNNQWTTDQLKILCYMHKREALTDICLQLGRSETAVSQKLRELKLNNLYDTYRN